MDFLVEYEGYKLIKKYNSYYIRLFLGEIVPTLCELKISESEGTLILEDNSQINKVVNKYSKEVDWTLESFIDASIVDYLRNNGIPEMSIDDYLKQLKSYEDILMEFYDYVLLDEFPKDRAVVIYGYTAQKLCEKFSLSVLGAYNYLIYLREYPDEALADLERALPRK